MESPLLPHIPKNPPPTHSHPAPVRRPYPYTSPSYARSIRSHEAKTKSAIDRCLHNLYCWVLHSFTNHPWWMTPSIISIATRHVPRGRRERSGRSMPLDNTSFDPPNVNTRHIFIPNTRDTCNRLLAEFAYKQWPWLHKAMLRVVPYSLSITFTSSWRTGKYSVKIPHITSSETWSYPWIIQLRVDTICLA